ncbi:MAG: acylphosphatase [Verrucomicrobiia bacterium]
MPARHVFYEGRVQGVGFRATVKAIARGYEVRGWVRNLSDGRVELLAAGEEAEVEAFLLGVSESVLKGHIKNMLVSSVPEPEGLSGFIIA